MAVLKIHLTSTLWVGKLTSVHIWKDVVSSMDTSILSFWYGQVMGISIRQCDQNIYIYIYMYIYIYIPWLYQWTQDCGNSTTWFPWCSLYHLWQLIVRSRRLVAGSEDNDCNHIHFCHGMSSLRYEVHALPGTSTHLPVWIMLSYEGAYNSTQEGVSYFICPTVDGIN